MNREGFASIDESRARRGIIEQVFGLLLWPLLTVGLVIGALYIDRIHTLKRLTIRHEAQQLKTVREVLKDRCDATASDLKFLIESGVLNSYLSVSDEASEEELTALFIGLLGLKSDYDQVRFLNLQGRELIRVVRHENRPVAVGPDQLQDKSGRYYVQNILSQPAGSVYVSPLDLNIEYGVLEQPPKPVIRFGAVIRKGDEHRGGLVIINYKAENLLDSIREIGAGATGSLYLLNPEGYYLIGPSEKSEFGFMYPDEPERFAATFAKDDPGVWKVVSRHGQGHTFSEDNLYTFSSVQTLSGSFFIDYQDGSPAGGGSRGMTASNQYELHLVSEVPASYFAGEKRAYIKFLLVLAAALLIPSVVVCFFLARARFRANQEVLLRYREHNRHLAELEDKVRRRTRELDDSNLKLSAEIAERLSTEKQLKRSNELLSGILESIDGIIYVADFENHRILFANEYLRDLFGFDPVGRQCWQFLHSSREGPCDFCTNEHLLDAEGEPAPPYHWEYQNPFNKKWYAAKDQAIRWSDGKYVRLEIAIDITEHKQLQHFLQEARKQAELTTGMRNRFVALVAHDLKSPFFSITQMLKRILEREEFSSRVHRQFLENIVENGHRMLQMIDNLLSMNRFETGEVKLERTFFDISKMTEEVLQNFHHQAEEKGIELVNSVPPATEVYADRYLYFVVLNNLVSNSVKFCGREDRIELYVPDPEDRSMTLAVSDTGKGMSKEYMDNLFKADVKTSRRGTMGEKGSGLGLIFCQDILKAHHGRIRVDSAPGAGTTFYVEVPECCRIEEGLPQTVARPSGTAENDRANLR